MRFGVCQQCNSYKFLEQRGRCITCIDDGQDDNCGSMLVASQCDQCGKLAIDCDHENASTTELCLNTLDATSSCTCDGFSKSAQTSLDALLEQVRTHLN